ncbi:hypothetical protein L7F22_033056 [Adiantum nelumboides]|nr:hypothetical protein [Adiantum nelumboides]
MDPTVFASSSIVDINNQVQLATATFIIQPAFLFVGFKLEEIFASKGEKVNGEVILCDVDGKLVKGVQVKIKVRGNGKQETKDNARLFVYEDVFDEQEIFVESDEKPVKVFVLSRVGSCNLHKHQHLISQTYNGRYSMRATEIATPVETVHVSVKVTRKTDGEAVGNVEVCIVEVDEAILSLTDSTSLSSGPLELKIYIQLDSKSNVLCNIANIVLHFTVNMLKAADHLKDSPYDLDLRIHHPCRSTNFGWISPRCAMLQAPPLPMRSLELKNSTPVADIRKLRLITAIKTPYLPDGRFDLEAYDKLVHSQIENGVEGVIVGGTTGEGQLMGWDEHIMLIGHTVNCFGGAIKVIGNTGSNSTGEAMHATEQGFAVGMHAALHINPYYGKTSQEGLLLHFQSVLSMGPSVIYNVPTRTGQDIPPSVIVKLMDIPNFAGVKECVGNDRIKGYTERNITVWSGNDDQCHDARWDFGARGVISVVSNLIPGLMRDLIIKGKDKGLNGKLLPLINWLFVEPNPIGLNTALAQLGIVRPVFRLPYVPLDVKKRQEFVELVKSIGREHFVGDRDVQLLSDEDFLVLPRY